MKLSKLLIISLIFTSSIAFAQQTKDTLTVEQQFNKLYRTSSSYQDYKVVGKIRFQALKKKVLDSVSELKSNIRSQEKVLRAKTDSISDLKNILSTLDVDLKQTITEKNRISFLGISLLKSQYNILVWSIIIILASLLGYFIFQFNSRNSVTKKAKEDLQEIEEELANHRKKSLEREQKLRRQLQDEINKQRGI